MAVKILYSTTSNPLDVRDTLIGGPTTLLDAVTQDVSTVPPVSADLLVPFVFDYIFVR